MPQPMVSVIMPVRNEAAYIERSLGEPGTRLQVDVRGKLVPVAVTRMPFIPQRYFRG